LERLPLARSSEEENRARAVIAKASCDDALEEPATVRSGLPNRSAESPARDQLAITYPMSAAPKKKPNVPSSMTFIRPSGIPASSIWIDQSEFRKS
jgi:hypothetical protein